MEKTGRPADRKLVIRLASLPDIDTLEDVGEHGYSGYGRFAALEDGGFWFGETRSTHPAGTETGWYWATTKDGELLVSARGAVADGEALFGKRKPVLALLIDELVKMRYIRKPASIELKRE